MVGMSFQCKSDIINVRGQDIRVLDLEFLNLVGFLSRFIEMDTNSENFHRCCKHTTRV